VDNWVVDISSWCEGDGDFLCFCPIENLGTPEEAVITGMALITSPEGFGQGKVVGIMHSAGQEAVDSWYQSHPDLVKRLEAR